MPTMNYGDNRITIQITPCLNIFRKVKGYKTRFNKACPCLLKKTDKQVTSNAPIVHLHTPLNGS